LPSGAYLVGTTFAGTALKKQKGKEPNKFIEENTATRTGLLLHPIKEFLERYLA
jgi:hypothetical protein